MSRKHLLPYIVTKILFLVVKIFKVYILHNFQIYDVVLLTIFHHALHYTPLPNYAITRSLYILTPSPISSIHLLPGIILFLTYLSFMFLCLTMGLLSFVFPLRANPILSESLFLLELGKFCLFYFKNSFIYLNFSVFCLLCFLDLSSRSLIFVTFFFT